MSNPNLMDANPQKVFTWLESDSKMSELIIQESTSHSALWWIQEKESTELIEIAIFLKNNERDDEIVYRLIERYWEI